MRLMSGSSKLGACRRSDAPAADNWAQISSDEVAYDAREYSQLSIPTPSGEAIEHRQFELCKRSCECAKQGRLGGWRWGGLVVPETDVEEERGDGGFAATL